MQRTIGGVNIWALSFCFNYQPKIIDFYQRTRAINVKRREVSEQENNLNIHKNINILKIHRNYIIEFYRKPVFIDAS